MKRTVPFLLLVSFCVALIAIIYGCGSTTPTSTTTTTLLAGAAAGDAAYDAVTAVIGVADTSASLGSLLGITMTGFSVKRSATAPTPTPAPGAPPLAFFSPVPADGWVTVEGKALVSGESVQIRMYTAGGAQINAGFLADKKIATLEGINWGGIASKTAFSFEAFAAAVKTWINYPTDWHDTNTALKTAFLANANKYRPALSIWDYIFWSDISANPSMEANIQRAWSFNPPGTITPAVLLASYPPVAQPRAAVGQKFGSQEAHITGTHPDGTRVDMYNSVTTGSDGRPTSASGYGTITRASGVVQTVSNTMTFVNGQPAGGSMEVTVGTPDNLHLVMTMTATGAATGTVFNTAVTPEAEIGSLVIYGGADSTGKHGYFEDKATGTKHYF